MKKYGLTSQNVHKLGKGPKRATIAMRFEGEAREVEVDTYKVGLGTILKYYLYHRSLPWYRRKADWLEVHDLLITFLDNTKVDYIDFKKLQDEISSGKNR